MMEATSLAKRALFNIPKFLPQGSPGNQSTKRLVSRACSSTAYERAEGSNAVEGEGSSEISDAPRDVMYEAKHRSFATEEGRPQGSTTSFTADTAKDEIKKAVEVAENVGDTAKKTLDGALKTTKDTTQGIKEILTKSDDEKEIEKDVAVDDARKVDQLLDTKEYRSIKELRAKAGAYDKAQ